MPAEDPIGRMAQRRITDAAAKPASRSRRSSGRRERYAPGDTDLAWTRHHPLAGLLAAALDQPPYETVTTATVTGGRQPQRRPAGRLARD